MKLFAPTLLLGLALSLLPPTLRAQGSGSVPPAVAQLLTDLAAIPAGSTVTVAEHQALVADLDTLATGVFTPDPADLDELATDLGTVAATGLFTSDLAFALAADFIADPGDPDDQDGWLVDVEDDVAIALSPVDETDPITTVDPTLLTSTAGGGGKIDGSYERRTFALVAEGIPAFLLENYAGSVRLATRKSTGTPAVSTLVVRTNGLPPINPYAVSMTRRSDGASVTLGKLHVHNLYYAVDFLALVGQPAAELLSGGRATFGGHRARHPLPTGFDPDDVASVTLTDAQGVVRLAVTIAEAQPTRQLEGAEIRLSGTSVAPAPAPSARVVVRHKATAAHASDRFRLSAHHLPAGAPVTLLADGVAIGQYTTTSRGQLFIIEGFDPTKLDPTGRSLPFQTLPPGTNLAGAKNFSLVDAQGATLVTGTLD